MEVGGKSPVHFTWVIRCEIIKFFMDHNLLTIIVFGDFSFRSTHWLHQNVLVCACVYLYGGGWKWVGIFTGPCIWNHIRENPLRQPLSKNIKFCAKHNFLESLVVFRVHNDLFQSNQCSFNQVNVRFQTF